MIKLSGLSLRDEANPAGDIAIEITGLRPGEKLYEELLIGDDPIPTSHPRIMKAHEDFLSWTELAPQLEALADAAQNDDLPAMNALLLKHVHGYEPGGAPGHTSVY